MTRDDAEKLKGMLCCPILLDYPEVVNAVQLREHPLLEQKFRFYDEQSINNCYATPFRYNHREELIPKDCVFTRAGMLPQHIIPTKSSRLFVICMAVLNEQRDDILGRKDDADEIREWFTTQLNDAQRAQAAVDLAECKHLAALEGNHIPVNVLNAVANNLDLSNIIAIPGINGITVCREAITWQAIRELKALHIHLAAPPVVVVPVLALPAVIPQVVDNNPLVPMSIEQIDTLIDFLKCSSSDNNNNKVFPPDILDVCQLQAHPHADSAFRSNFYNHPALQGYLIDNDDHDPISRLPLTDVEQTVTPSRRAFAMGMVAVNQYINRMIQSLGVSPAEIQLRGVLQGKALPIVNWLNTHGVDRVKIKWLEVDILRCAVLPADGGAGLPADPIRGFLGDAVTPATVARFKTLGVGLTLNTNAINLAIENAIHEVAEARLELMLNQVNTNNRNINNRNNNANLYNFPGVVGQPAPWPAQPAANPVNNPATAAAQLAVLASRVTSTVADLSAITAHRNRNATSDTAVIGNAHTRSEDLITIARRTVLATDLALITAHRNRNAASDTAVIGNAHTRSEDLITIARRTVLATDLALITAHRNRNAASDTAVIANVNTRTEDLFTIVGRTILETDLALIAAHVNRNAAILTVIASHARANEATLAVVLAVGPQNDLPLINNRNTGAAALEAIARRVGRTQAELLQIINHPKTMEAVLVTILARPEFAGAGNVRNVPVAIQQAVDAKRLALGGGQQNALVFNAAAAIVAGGGQAAVAQLPPAVRAAAINVARQNRF